MIIDDRDRVTLGMPHVSEENSTMFQRMRALVVSDSTIQFETKSGWTRTLRSEELVAAIHRLVLPGNCPMWNQPTIKTCGGAGAIHLPASEGIQTLHN